MRPICAEGLSGRTHCSPVVTTRVESHKYLHNPLMEGQVIHVTSRCLIACYVTSKVESLAECLARIGPYACSKNLCAYT